MSDRAWRRWMLFVVIAANIWLHFALLDYAPGAVLTTGGVFDHGDNTALPEPTSNALFGIGVAFVALNTRMRK